MQKELFNHIYCYNCEIDMGPSSKWAKEFAPEWRFKTIPGHYQSRLCYKCQYDKINEYYYQTQSVSYCLKFIGSKFIGYIILPFTIFTISIYIGITLIKSVISNL